MYDNLMNKFKFGGIDNPDIYLDETVLRMCYSHRRMFVKLAQQLMREGQNEKALQVLDRSQEVIPPHSVSYDALASGSIEMAECYLKLGQRDKAVEILQKLANRSVEYLDWYLSFNDKAFQANMRDMQYEFSLLNTITSMLENTEHAAVYQKIFDEKFNKFRHRVGA